MDFQPIIYGILSVIIVSLISLVGSVFFLLKTKDLNKMVLYLISLSVGALLGDVFIHILPEAFENFDTLKIGIYVLSGIIFSFIIEKIIHYRHRHIHQKDHSHKEHPHTFAIMNLMGDLVHNFIDGIIIATSYLISIPVGIATTIAVILHEIPQEISDFGVLVYGGYTRTKALLANFLISLTALLGAIITILIGTRTENILIFLIPFAAGNFIYIAGSDLISELHKETKLKVSLAQLILFILGIL